MIDVKLLGGSLDYVLRPGELSVVYFVHLLHVTHPKPRIRITAPIASKTGSTIGETRLDKT